MHNTDISGKVAATVLLWIKYSGPLFMSINYTISRGQSYIEIIVSGAGDIDSAKRLWTEVHKECISYSCKKILGIGRNHTAPSLIDGYAHVGLWHTIGFDNSYRIAWVESTKNVYPRLRIIETALINRGLPGRLFDNIDDAREWILKE